MFPGKLGPIMSEGTQFSGTLEEERTGYAWNDNCGVEKMFNSSTRFSIREMAGYIVGYITFI